MLNELSRWFESMGVHPVLGGAIAGTLLVLFFRALMSRRDPADDTARGQSPRSAGKPAVHTLALTFGESRIQIQRNGENVLLPDEVSAQILQLVKDNKKIEAIKLLRGASGLGLYDAKQLIDSIEGR